MISKKRFLPKYYKLENKYFEIKEKRETKDKKQNEILELIKKEPLTDDEKRSKILYHLNENIKTVSMPYADSVKLELYSMPVNLALQVLDVIQKYKS